MDEKLEKLLRAMVISWDVTEAGAATVDPEIPYGSKNVLADIKRLCGVTADGEAWALHRGTEAALLDFLARAQLKPGKYTYPNPLKTKHADATVNIFGSLDAKQVRSDTITFEFTAQHRKLLRAASIRWTAWAEEEGEGFFDTPGIDPKRPYGSMTFFYKDMAVTLGIDYKSDTDMQTRERFFQKLHHEMQPALQVFLRFAQLPPTPGS